jgi:CMP/dCMP kinase
VKQLRIDLVNDSFVVAIDGPAGAGKSTASRLLAERLGFEFLDTGAMYRCVTLAALRAGLDTRDAPAVAALAKQVDIRLDREQVWLDGEDVSDAIRTPDVSAAIGKIADNPEVRQHLSRLQREWAHGKCAVTEGRDQGTVVFHDSPCKIFLTASEDERARRRCEELAAKGIAISFDDVLSQQRERDSEDFNRAHGGLRQADDARQLLTDGMSLSEVVEAMVAIVTSKLPESIKSRTAAAVDSSRLRRDDSIESHS